VSGPSTRLHLHARRVAHGLELSEHLGLQRTHAGPAASDSCAAAALALIALITLVIALVKVIVVIVVVALGAS
jgi:hypothetical protein